MIRLAIPGGLYCDALPRPGMEYVCMMKADGLPVKTHLGDLRTDDGVNPLFCRCTAVDGFRFAGQANNTIHGPTVMWDGAWAFSPLVPSGLSPVIYDLEGMLQIGTADKHWGSNGARYVDITTGVIVTGDATYSSEQAVPPFEGLSEWTYLGEDLYGGQCNIIPGATIFDRRNGRMGMLEPGVVQFTRWNRYAGSNEVGIAMIKQGGGDSVMIWATMAELRALPLVSEPVPPIPPDPPVPPTPIPVPPLPPVIRNNLLLYLFQKGSVMPFEVPRVLAAAQLRADSGGFRAVIQNPIDDTYMNLPPKGTQLPGFVGAALLAVHADGSCTAVDGKTPTVETLCTKQGGFLVFKGGKADDSFLSIRRIIPFME